jgi:phenylpropionate dioxygenase-like ring-hydroxylating dioxygenase large terminal subunit
MMDCDTCHSEQDALYGDPTQEAEKSMKNSLLSDDYIDPGLFAVEMDGFFLGQWHFACLDGDIANHNDYVTTTIGRKEVVVQNFHGRIAAFTNTCSHRFSALRKDPSGNGPLQCPYHRWLYDARGVPVGIPLRETFPEVRDRGAEDFALESWSVAQCGSFVFVHLGAPRVPLAEFLGTQFDWLERMSRVIGGEFDRFEVTSAANWKLLMQNTIEFYHVYSVHPQTFAPMVPPAAEVVEVPVPPPHLRYVATMREDGVAARAARKFDPIFKRTDFEFSNGYEHLLVFPCTTFGHTNGRSYSIFQYFPEAVDRTRLVVRHFQPLVKDLTDTERRLTDGLKDIAGRFTRALAQEDGAACELVQRGLRSRPARLQGTLSEVESLVARFQQHYLAAMAGARDSA